MGVSRPDIGVSSATVSDVEERAGVGPAEVSSQYVSAFTTTTPAPPPAGGGSFSESFSESFSGGV